MHSSKSKSMSLNVIGISALISGASILASSLGFMNKVVQANVFGTGLAMDAFFGVLAAPAALSGMVPGVLMSVVLPVLSRLNKSDKEQQAFLSSLFGLTLVISMIVLVFGIYTSDSFVRMLVPTLSNELFDITISTSRMLWGMASLSILVGLLNTFQLSNRNFIRVSLVSLLLPLLSLVFTICLWESISIRSTALGLLIGSIIQIVCLFSGFRQLLKIEDLVLITHPLIKGIILQIPLAIMSRLPYTVFPIISAYWIAKQAPGSLSYLGYSQSFAGLLSVSLGYGIATVTFPDITESIAAGQYKSVVSTLEYQIRHIFLLGAVIVSLIITFRIPILQVAFQHGTSDDASINGIATVLPWYLVGAVSLACLNVIRNLHYALGQFTILAWLGVSVTIFFFGLAGLLGYLFSYQGISIAYAISLAFFLVAAIGFVQGRRLGLWSRSLILFLSKVILIVTISSSLGHSLLIQLDSFLQIWWSIIVSVLVMGISAILLSSTILPITEVRDLFVFFRQIYGRRA